MGREREPEVAGSGRTQGNSGGGGGGRRQDRSGSWTCGRVADPKNANVLHENGHLAVSHRRRPALLSQAQRPSPARPPARAWAPSPAPGRHWRSRRRAAPLAIAADGPCHSRAGASNERSLKSSVQRATPSKSRDVASASQGKVNYSS